MDTWQEYYLGQERWKHLIEATEQRRLVREAQVSWTPRRNITKIYGPVLVRVGGWLVMWGKELQSRYSEVKPVHS